MERIPNAVYTKELREEAVKLVTEQGLTIPDVGRRLSIPKSTIAYWVEKKRKENFPLWVAQRKTLQKRTWNWRGLHVSLPSKNGARFLTKSSSVLCERAAVRYALIRKLRPHYTIPFMCRMLNVSPSGYYAWSSRPPSEHAQEETRLEIEIKGAHTRNRGTCRPEGYRRTLQSMVSPSVYAGSDGSGKSSEYAVNR